MIPSRDCVSAGQALAGEVLGGLGPVTISLMRVEQTPSGRRLRACGETIATPVSSETDATASRARFELDIPEDAVPSGRGAQCSLSYTLLARSRHHTVAANAWAAIEVVARGQAHVKPRVDRFDRFIAAVPSRLFHIELHDAVLAGDGYIAGRVHRHGRCPLGTMMLDVGCTEAWRSRPSWRGAPPQWDERVMWAATAPVQLDDDRGWAPFRCEIPAGLPCRHRGGHRCLAIRPRGEPPPAPPARPARDPYSPAFRGHLTERVTCRLRPAVLANLAAAARSNPRDPRARDQPNDRGARSARRR